MAHQSMAKPNAAFPVTVTCCVVGTRAPGSKTSDA